MLEDFTMEKKSGRSNQLPVKGNATESKKNPDSIGNKIFPRTSRRREPFNPQGTKYETNRKPLPQKSKSIDKRPRQRGQYYGCGKEDTKVAEDEEFDLFPHTQGSKKQNLNHLLNFHYAPRDSINAGHQNWRPSAGGRGKNNCKWLMSTHKHKYNKEQFLQANCQFVVKSAGNYSSYMENPDMLVDWDYIEQIWLRSSELLSCPICLYPPVAAKMTRCGHVFCWSCILHYLALSDKAWRKCPICYEAVHKNDLRSVTAVPHTEFSVGEEITLRLMKRKRGSLVALPVDQSEIYCTDKLLSVSETGVDVKYSKLLLASSLEVVSIIEKEKIELTAQLVENQGCPEACFVEEALELLKLRAAIHSGDSNVPDVSNSVHPSVFENVDEENIVTGFGNYNGEHIPPEKFNDSNLSELCDNADLPEMCDPMVPEMYQYDQSCLDSLSRVRYESVSSEGFSSEEGTIAVEDIEASSVDQSSFASGVTPLKDFYFYQAADGQHIYLHALNVRMLEHFYGSLKNCPLNLTGRIVEKESGSMTEELRQRLRYLQHLPVTCQFEVAEIALKPPIVNKNTLEYFHDQLETRKRKRARRAREEHRREKRINEEEKRRWGRFPSPRISINSHQQFPFCGVDTENIALTNSASAISSLESSPSRSLDEYSVSTTIENLSIDERAPGDITATTITENCGSPSGPSFAQMLRDGKSKPVSDWPSTSHVWKSLKATEHNKGKQRKANASDSEAEQEGYMPLRSNESLGDAIAQAMEKAAATASSSKDNSGSAGKKKKKQKQKVLFATGLACKSK